MHLTVARRPRRSGSTPQPERTPQGTPWERYCARRCASSTAAVLNYFLGLFGAHRFYVGRKGSALAMLTLSLGAAGGLLLAATLGTTAGAVFLAPLFAVACWSWLDTYTLRDMVREHNRELARSVGLPWSDVEAWERHQEDWFGAAR